MLDEAYPVDGGSEVVYPRPRELKLYANASFIAQMIAKHQMWIDEISTTKEGAHGFLCQARISATGHQIGQAFNGIWIGRTEREAVIKSVSEGVTQLAFHMAPGIAPVEYETHALLITGARQVVIDMSTGQVVAKHSIPPLTDQLRGLIEKEGRMTWEQFQAMVSDVTLDVIEGDIEAALWTLIFYSPLRAKWMGSWRDLIACNTIRLPADGMAMSRMHGISVRPNRGYPVAKHICRVRSHHRAFPTTAFVEQHFFAIFATTVHGPSTTAIVLLAPNGIGRPHPERLTDAFCVVVLNRAG